MHPVSMALLGMSGWLAVLSFCAMVMPTYFLDAAQCCGSVAVAVAVAVKARDYHGNQLAVPAISQRSQKTVMTSAQPRGFDMSLRWNSPLSTCKSGFAGMMKTRLGSISKFSVMRSTGIVVKRGSLEI